jgi:hypothetical protein
LPSELKISRPRSFFDGSNHHAQDACSAAVARVPCGFCPFPRTGQRTTAVPHSPGHAKISCPARPRAI